MMTLKKSSSCPRTDFLQIYQDMNSFVLKLIIISAMLLVLPMLGILVTGLPSSRYLTFPPETLYVRHAPFSWPVFIIYVLIITGILSPFVYKSVKSFKKIKNKKTSVEGFPWWGWFGLAAGLASWLMAWTRFPWFSPFQPHTFFPLWVSFILVVNALTFARKGRCMMTERPCFFLLLFPVSAAFWWYFEYLNRFVQNWSYMETPLGAWEYFLRATLPFSTVLPAVLGVREWILTYKQIDNVFKKSWVIDITSPKIFAWNILLISAVGLMVIGIFPDYFFPLLWLSPLGIIIPLQVLLGESHALSDISEGDWRGVISSILAALLCGWFWEMWNYYSLAKWEYHIPFVNRFHLFEMPILGYAGYLPFGLECAVIGSMLESLMGSKKR